jgi:cytochrome c5
MATKQPYDASDPDQVKLAEDRAADEQKDIVFIMSQPRGRRWVYTLIWGICHMDSISFIPGKGDGTGFNEGARSVGLALASVLREETPKLYLKMLEENQLDG